MIASLSPLWLTEITCQSSYPRKSAKARPPGTCREYLSCAASAKPPSAAGPAASIIISKDRVFVMMFSLPIPQAMFAGVRSLRLKPGARAKKLATTAAHVKMAQGTSRISLHHGIARCVAREARATARSCDSFATETRASRAIDAPGSAVALSPFEDARRRLSLKEISMTHWPRHGRITGPIVMIGFGSIGKGTLPLDRASLRVRPGPLRRHRPERFRPEAPR